MDIIKEKSVCFSGHRIIRKKDAENLQVYLDRAVNAYVRRGFDTFICGGAMGFDTVAAEAVLRKREDFPEVKLVLALPCRDQTSKWKKLDDIVKYKEILGQADEVVYTADFYTSGCMHARNRYMVDSSSACICYKYSERGGTAYTVGYAEKNGLEIINLARFSG